MITLSRENRLESLWSGIRQSNIIPEEIRMETEQNLVRNKLELSVNFSDQRLRQDDLQHKLDEYYGTIALVTPLLKESSSLLRGDAKIMIVDLYGVVIYCEPEETIGFCCPVAEVLKNNQQLNQLVETGIILELNYDNGVNTIAFPIFNEFEKLQFFCALSDRQPITLEMANILYLTTQIIQQRYKYRLMLDGYTTSFMNAFPQSVMLLDENAHIVNVNQPCLDILNVSNRDILKGMHIRELIDDGAIYNSYSILTADREDRFILNFLDNKTTCQLIFKKQINTPFGKQMVLSFEKMNDNLKYSRQLTSDVMPHTSSAFDRIAGSSSLMNKIKYVAMKSAGTEANILLEGETGTGKELFAQAIHQESQRTGQFIAINCGAIPSQLIQSELFGYEEGAFTGAMRRGSPGKIENADGGTLFLDEIGEMPMDMQVNLLRFLQDKTVSRLGSSISKKVDVRVIAATNRNLKHEVANGRFREDLYYRLNVINIQIPPLRKRKEDIPLIADTLLAQLCQIYNMPLMKLGTDQTDILLSYDWPGNAREMRNIIERAFILRQGETLYFDDLPNTLEEEGIDGRQEIEAIIEKAEKETIEKYLRMYQGNIPRTANAMGITRQTLYRKIKILNIDRMPINN